MSSTTQYTIGPIPVSVANSTVTATSMVDIIESGIITTSNASTSYAISQPHPTSFVEIDTTGKGTVNIQISGTWACDPAAGIFVIATVNGSDWVILADPDRLIKISSLAYCTRIENGLNDIWQIQVAGFAAIRIVAIGAGFTGAANIAVRASTATRSILADSSGVPAVRFLTQAGNSTGNYNMNGNYTTTAIQPYYSPPPTFKFYINSLSIQISDDASFNQPDYGGIPGGLINGVTLNMINHGVTTNFIGGLAIKKNYEWYSFTPVIQISTFAQTTNQTMVVNIQINEHYGLPLMLNGATGDRFYVNLNDNFTGLVSHTFLLRGRLVG